MPAGISTSLHIDTFLTNVAAGYSNKTFIAKQVLDVISSPKETGKIAVMGNEHYRLDFVERARGADTPRIDWQPGTPVSFDASEWTLEKPIDPRDAALYDSPFKAEEAATFVIRKKLLLQLEYLVGTLMTTSGNFGGTTAAGTVWATSASATPITNIRTAMEAVRARTGNATLYGLCGSAIWNKLVQTSEAKTLYLNTVPAAAAPAVIKPNALAQAIGLEDIYVGPAIRLTSAEGATDAFTDIWGTSVFAVYAKADPGMEPSPFNLGFGALLVPSIEGFPTGTDVVMDRYYDPRAKSDVVRGTSLYDQLAVNAALGQLITGC